MDPKKFKKVEAIKGLSQEALAEEVDSILTGLRELLSVENPTEEQTATAEAAAQYMRDLRAEQVERDGAAQARAERMRALADEVNAEPEADEDEDEDTEEETEEEESEETPAAEETPSAEVVEERQPVAASGRRTGRASLAGRRPKTGGTASDERGPVTITAAADLGVASTGATIDMAQVAQAIEDRTRSFGMPSGDGSTVDIRRYGVAKFTRQYRDYEQANGDAADQEKIDRVASEFNLPGGSLTAAGGWCAPSETLYDLCSGETAEGMVSVPEVAVKRGGLRFSTGIDYATLYSANGFTQTETQAIAGTTKPCYEVPCPTFTDYRMDVIGLCIKVPILTMVGYPEMVQRVTQGALVAHQHRVNAYVINKMVTIAGTAVTGVTQGGSVASALDALEFQAEYLRGVYRLSLNASMEVVLPYWVRSVMRADLANRNGVDMLSVSDQQLQSHFAARKLAVQWVYDWQDLPAGATYPTTFQALIYPAGTYIKGTSDVISLDAVYDAASLAVNTYTGTFTEEGILVAKRCFQSKLVTLPVCLSGQTGKTDVTCTVTP